MKRILLLCRRFVPVVILIFVGPILLLGVVRDGQLDPAFDVKTLVVSQSAIIRCIVPLPNGKYIVGGEFRNISGEAANNIARLNQDGSFDNTFSGNANAVVNAVFPLADGKLLISGDFSQYNGISRNRIVRINSDGSLDSTFDISSGTTTISVVGVQPDEKILVQGAFTSIGGVQRNRFARLNQDGTVDTSFEVGSSIGPVGGGTYINKAFVLPDLSMILIGKFPSYQSIERNGIVKILPNGTIDPNFVPQIGTACASEVLDVAIHGNNKILIMGNVRCSSSILRLEANGAIDSTFVANNGSVQAGQIYSLLVQSDRKVVIGGDFGSFTPSGSPLMIRKGLLRFDENGTVDPSFPTEADGGKVYSLVQSGGGIVAGGNFASISGRVRGGVGRLSVLDGSVDISFVGSLLAPTRPNTFLNLPNGKMLVGGNFDAVGNNFKSKAVRLLADGSPDPTFSLDPSLTLPVTAFSVQSDGRILLGSSVDSFPTPSNPGLCRVNNDGSLDTGFNADLGDIVTVSNIIVLDDGRILVSGTTTQLISPTTSGLIRLNSDGSADGTFSAIVAGSVSSTVLQPDGKILVGGSFTSVNGTSVGRLVRLNANGSVDTTFGVGTGAGNNSVNSIVLDSNNNIYVGGAFTSWNGVSQSRYLVRLTATGAIDPTFGPPKITSAIFALAQTQDKKIIIGGDVRSSVDAAPRQTLLRLLENGAVDFSFEVKPTFISTGSTPRVLMISGQGNTVYFSGQFDIVNGVARYGIAKISIDRLSRPPFFDFDGDGVTDIAVFRPSNGLWFRRISYSQTATRVFQWGADGDKIAPADYDGDSIADIAVFRPSGGAWYIVNSSTTSPATLIFGLESDLPVPADYDGDGKADIAIYRPSTGQWWLNRTTAGLTAIQFGLEGDVPVPGDFDGDGKADLVVFRPSNGIWYMQRSTAGGFAIQFGNSKDKIAPADYDGDGKMDVGIYRPSQGTWYSVNSSNGGYPVTVFGLSTDIPVPGDYDGDGKADIAIFRPSNGQWWLNRTTSGLTVVQYGSNGDKPTMSAFGN